MSTFAPMPRNQHNGSNDRPNRGATPLLVHFDVNKTVIQSDSIQMKGIEDGIREGIAELFWGHKATDANGKLVWEWTKSKPSCYPPSGDESDSRIPVNYFEFCRSVVKDKQDRKEVVNTFKMVGDEARIEMDKLLQVTLKKMQLSPEIRFTKQAEESGLRGSTISMFPTLFHFVAALQRSKRIIAVLFRSFGADHESIKSEWNAFCEMRHPVYSKFLEGVGPLDGTVPGVPDRRIHYLHTMYRDAEGPVLILNTFTNGPPDRTWDSWAKGKPKPTVDDRNGRGYYRDVLKADAVEGMSEIQNWMKNHIFNQGTAAIKDDWAWWQFHGERAFAGKLLTLIAGPEETEQLFFDDNIDISDTRIVDCRDVEGTPVPGELSINRVCTKVNPVEALLDDGYFLRKLQLCHGEHLDLGASLIDFQRQLTEVEDQKSSLQKQVKALHQQLKSLTDDNRRMKLLHRINVKDESHLRDLLAKEFDLEIFGKNGFRTISDLWWELENQHCWLELDEHGKLVRSFEMVFLKLQYKTKNSAEDLILIESHEQGSDGRVQSRNYLPGVRKALRETSFTDALARWQERGLACDLSSVVAQDGVPVFAPEAPNQQTGETQAFPIQCRIQQSEATFILASKAYMSHADLLQKIGLPGGKHFTVCDTEMHGGVVTRFFRWDKMATCQAILASSGRGLQKTTDIDIAQVCDKLFRGHPRQEVYERMLLQMFDIFTAKKLCGGFSGSVVIRVQPYETDGRTGEPCIVKLDAGEAIRDEYVNSVNVFKALPDRAARILGDAAYATNKAGEEFGAMRLELAGACWNVPELAQGSANLLSTFKDLLLYESEQIMVGTAPAPGDMRPFGNVHSVLAETFGPGGVVGALRKGGAGLHRAIGQPLLWGWYTLKGKESKFNPYTAKGQYPPEPHMRLMYKEHFGVEMPNLKEIVVGTIRPMLENLSKQVKDGNVVDLCPLVGLAHGDLNAANIMIDALDAVWLIDFATSVDLPVLTDMCKFEMACLFEYAVIPITPKMLLNFGSTDKAAWGKNNIGDWLKVGQDIAEMMMIELVSRGHDRLSRLSEEELNTMIEDVAANSNKAPHKQREIIRSLKARLCIDESMITCAYKYCRKISHTLLRGDYVLESLNLAGVPPIEPVGLKGEKGAMSLKYFMDIGASVRRFMLQDILGCFRDYSNVAEGCQACDALSLQMWLPILRESYRLIGYSDIPPQHKLWSIYHCNVVAENVLRVLATLTSQFQDLKGLQIMSQLQHDLADQSARKESTGGDLFLPRDGFTEAASHWIYFNADRFQDDSFGNKILHQVHDACPVYHAKPGFYSPVLGVLSSEGKPLRLVFAENIDAPEGLKLYLRDDFENLGINVDADSQPLFDPGAVADGIGYVTMKPGTNEVDIVTLKSRLFFMTIALAKLRLDEQDDSDSEDTFDITAWSGGMFTSSDDVTTSTHSTKSVRVGSTHSSKFGREFSREAVPTGFKFQPFIKLEAVVRASDGQEVLGARLSIGMPTVCYPAGAKLCIDTTVVQQQRSASPEVVVCKLNESGNYRVRDAAEPTEDSERDFAPTYNNHVFLTPCNYKKKQRIIVNKDSSAWVDCEVVQMADAETNYRYRLLSSLPSNTDDVTETRMGLVSGKDEAPVSQGQTERVLWHVSTMNSGPAWLPAAIYEEEVHKMKVYFRARHSFIIDGLSGMRLGIKSCALPTLHMQSRRDESYGTLTRSNSTLSTATSGSLSASLKRHSRKMSVIEQSSMPEVRHGWSMLTDALERYEVAAASCSPNAFLVLGSPGSGKSCLICRLIMDCLERHQNVVPVLIMVNDLVKRSEPSADSGEMDSADVSAWFDKYLRLTYGEDSLRYKMVRQAILMHRVLFLFEGLEDGGNLTPVIEHLIKDIVTDRHLVVITSRRFSAGTSTLEGMDEHISTMELQSLTDEQQRSIAHARLGHSGMASLDQFMKQLRESQSVTQDNNEEGDGQGENVFGNPMMLSMLLCYLQMKLKEKEERDPRKDKGEDDSVTITAVYRVAVDVMLNRVQSKQQADRHNKDEKVEQCKRILEKMAMTMQLQQRTSIDASSFEKNNLDPNLRDTWLSLKEAVVAGHAMFLRTSQTEGDSIEMSFVVKGFLHYFAASAVANIAGIHLPGLVSLLTEPSWSPSGGDDWRRILEMLAELNAYKYVEMIQSQLETFQPDKGNTFLHLAAQVGHRPVFQLLQMFSESHQAALSAPNANKQVPLHIAAEKGNIQLCALMVQHKAPIDAEDDRGALPMHVALQNRQFAAAKYLLDRYMEKEKRSSNARRSGVPKEENPAEILAAKILNKAQDLTEDEFKSDIHEVFTELRFFGSSDQGPKKQSIGALLSVFWICRNQYENFVRPQPPEKKLTPESWQKMTTWTTETVELTDSPARVAAMLVFVEIANLGKVKHLKQAFAPGVEDTAEALRSILQRAPILMPSFARLEAHLQHMIISALKASDFNFGQFLQAENLPSSLVTVKDILGDKEATANTLGFFLFRLFAGMCGLFAFKTLEGSAFMDDRMYSLYSMGLDVLQHLMDENCVQVYHRFLARRAQDQGLRFDAKDEASVALVRLACLARTFVEKETKFVKAAFEALDPRERASLTGFLNADGINVKGFLPYNAPNFLTNAHNNQKVGLLAAMKMFNKVFQMAEKEYEDSDKLVITIFFDELAKLAEQCKDPQVFDFTQFEISRFEGHKSDHTCKVHLSPWQLVRDPAKLEYFREESESLVQETMNQMVRENMFLKRLPQVFPEMKFFDGKNPAEKAAHRQTMGAVLAAFWIASDHAEAFTRGQPTEKKLAGTSWKTATHMPGTKNSDTLNVVFVASVVHGIAKIPKFHKQLAPHAASRPELLVHVMDTCPEVLPSYMRLSAQSKDVVKWCVTQDLNFEEFMYAEALPASLTSFKNSMRQIANRRELGHMTDEFLPAFLLFTFAELSGSHGSESLEGSVYMTEDTFSKFYSALDILQQLQEDHRTEQVVYDQLLQERATHLQLDFNPEEADSRATVRLACWAEVADAQEKEGKGRHVSVALQKDLTTEEREKLTSYLVADGITSPGFVLSGAKAFFKSAQENPKVGLAAAIRTTLKIYEAAAEEFRDSRRPICKVLLDRISKAVVDYSGHEAIEEVTFELQRDSEGEAFAVSTLPVPEEHAKEKEKEAAAAASAEPAAAAPQAKAAPGSATKVEKENGTVQDTDAKLRAVMEDLLAMQKQHEALRTEHASLREVNGTLRDEHKAALTERDSALQESGRLQSVTDGFKGEAVRLRQESQDLRAELHSAGERQASGTAVGSTGMVAKRDFDDVLTRTGSVSGADAQSEKEAIQLRSELNSAEAGLNGLNMEIGELTMELAKLRAQAASDARLQRSSSEARIELLELRRQLLGRETMLGHEREVADKRLEASRQESKLLNERLEVATRERDWAMQELHVARRDERLAAVRSRSLADEGVGLRSRCEALEAAHRAMMWELEVLRGGGQGAGADGIPSAQYVAGTASPSASSMTSSMPRAHSPLGRSMSTAHTRPNTAGSSALAPSKLEAPPPMAASAYAAVSAGVTSAQNVSVEFPVSSPGMGTPNNGLPRNMSVSSPSSSRTTPLHRVSSRTGMTLDSSQTRLNNVRQHSGPFYDRSNSAVGSQYAVSASSKSPARVVVAGMPSAVSPARTPRTASPVGSARQDHPMRGAARVDHIQIVRAPPYLGDSASARSTSGSQTVLRRMVPQHKSTGNLARYVDRGGGSPSPHLRAQLQSRQAPASDGAWN